MLQQVENKSQTNLNQTDGEEEEDHVLFYGFNLLIFENFKKKLADLKEFAGFTPRWTLLSKLRNTENTNLNTSALLLVIVIYWDLTNLIGFKKRSRHRTRSFFLSDNSWKERLNGVQCCSIILKCESRQKRSSATTL